MSLPESLGLGPGRPEVAAAASAEMPPPPAQRCRAAELGQEEVQPACLRLLALFLFQTHKGLRGQAHWERVSELRSRVGAFLGVHSEEEQPRPPE